MIWTKQQQTGFTITEMVVSLALFGLLVVGIMSMMGALQQTQRNEKYLELANTVAEDIVEAARNGEYSALTAGQTYDRTSRVPEELPGGVASMAVSSTTTLPDLKRVEVDVSYEVGTVTRHVYATALIGQGGITP